MNDASRAESILPSLGAVPPPERTLGAHRRSQLAHSPSGSPRAWPELGARRGASVRLIDGREAVELGRGGPLRVIAPLHGPTPAS